LEVNTAESITLTSISIPSTSLPGQCMQLRVNLLICLLKHWNQVLGLPTVFWGKECIWCTGCIAPACATNAVNVIFRGVWVIKVDHIFDPIHICALNNMQVSCSKQYKYTACLTQIYCMWQHCTHLLTSRYVTKIWQRVQSPQNCMQQYFNKEYKCWSNIQHLANRDNVGCYNTAMATMLHVPLKQKMADQQQPHRLGKLKI
jgi:hypothetical protein